MDKITRDIYICRDALAQPIRYVAGTNAVPIELKFRDWTIPSSGTAAIYLTKPSGLIVYDAAEIDTDNNTVTITPTTQLFAEPGNQWGQVQIVDGDTIAATFKLLFIVGETMVDSEAIESTDEYTALEALIAQAQQVVADTTDAIEALQSSVSTNTSNISSLQSSVSELNSKIGTLIRQTFSTEAKSVDASTWTCLGTVDLDAGTWVITGFAAGGTPSTAGTMVLSVCTSSTTGQNGYGMLKKYTAENVSFGESVVVYPLRLTTSTTMYLWVQFSVACTVRYETIIAARIA